MTMDKLLEAMPVVMLALAMGLAVVVGLALMLDVGSRYRFEWMGYVFVAILLTMVASVILQGRVLGAELSDMVPISDDSGASNWVSRVITLLCVALAAERAARFVFRREYKNSRGMGLVVAFMLYLVAVNLVSSLLGSQPSFSHHLLYAPLFALAMFAYAQANSDQGVVIARNALLVFVLMSLAALAVRIDMVAESNYRAGLIPGFSLRFYGFATHPNTLAPLCFVLMSCLLLRPFQRPSVTALAWAAVSTCILLTQSKTSIGLVGILLVALILFRQIRAARERGRAEIARLVIPLWTILFLISSAVGLVTLVALLADLQIVQRLTRNVDFQQIATLTGRTTVWTETIKALQANPLFGYGPELWGVEFRIRTGMMFTHAHNQYLQTLGAGGILGFVALFGYLITLLVVAWRARVGSHGVTVALAVFLIVRGATEVPLSVSSPMQGEFLVQMILLMLCVAHSPAAQPLLVRSEKPHQLVSTDPKFPSRVLHS